MTARTIDVNVRFSQSLKNKILVMANEVLGDTRIEIERLREENEHLREDNKNLLALVSSYSQNITILRDEKNKLHKLLLEAKDD